MNFDQAISDFVSNLTSSTERWTSRLTGTPPAAPTQLDTAIAKWTPPPATERESWVPPPSPATGGDPTHQRVPLTRDKMLDHMAATPWFDKYSTETLENYADDIDWTQSQRAAVPSHYIDYNNEVSDSQSIPLDISLKSSQDIWKIGISKPSPRLDLYNATEEQKYYLQYASENSELPFERAKESWDTLQDVKQKIVEDVKNYAPTPDELHGKLLNDLAAGTLTESQLLNKGNTIADVKSILQLRTYYNNMITEAERGL